MRLKRFYIEDYRVLQNLQLDFVRGRESLTPAQYYALDFLAGVNGTGKSTVLQLLGKLFAWLEEQDYFPEAIDLEYTLGKPPHDEKQITITTKPETANKTEPGLYWRVDGGEWQKGKIEVELLPKHIIIYTTGSEDEWDEAITLEQSEEQAGDEMNQEFSDEAEVFLHEIPGHRSNADVIDEGTSFDPNRRLLFVRSSAMPLVALCGLIASRRKADNKDEEPLRDVLRSIGLDSLVGFSLRLRSHRNLTPPAQQEVANRLVSAADRVIRLGGDLLAVFDMDKQLTRNTDKNGKPSIFSIYGSDIELFQNLYLLTEHRAYYDSPLQEVNLFLKRSTITRAESIEESESSQQPMLHLFEWLSDGERSFLARMALFALFREDDLFILLDEPEVHFNDVWKREIVNMLDGIMRGHASHALITTHSSIALTDVPAQDILVLRRLGERTTGQGDTQIPGIETLGADPSDILVHVFGTRSASGERGIRYIREEIGRRNSPEELEELEKIVAPGYWCYRIQLEVQRLRGTLQ